MKAMCCMIIVLAMTAIADPAPCTSDKDKNDPGMHAKKAGYFSKGSEVTARAKSAEQYPFSYFGMHSDAGISVYRSSSGNTLKGHIDDNGFGSLVDDAGNLIVITPRSKENQGMQQPADMKKWR